MCDLCCRLGARAVWCLIAVGIALVPQFVTAEVVGEPVVVGTVAGIDRLQEIVDEVSAYGEKPEVGRFVRDRLQMLPVVEFLERGQPLGLLIFQRLAPVEPVLVGCLPVRDFPRLTRGLQNRFRLDEERPGEQWLLDLPKRAVLIRRIGNYAVFSDQRDVLEDVTIEWERWLPSKGPFDLAIQVRMDGISEELIELVLAGFAEEITQNAAQETGGSERERRIHGLLSHLVWGAGDLLARDTRRVDLGFRVDSGFELSVRWAARPESRLADRFSRLPVRSRTFAENSQAAVALHVALSLPEGMRELLAEAGLLLKEHLQTDFAPNLAPMDRHPAGAVFETLAASIEVGELNGFVEAVPATTDHMMLVAGLQVMKGEGLETSLRTILPYAEKSEDVGRIELDKLSGESVTVHRITPRKVRREDERLYGADSTFFVGTSPDAFWFAVGDSETSAAIENRLAMPRRTASPLVEAHWSLNEWIRLARRNGDDSDEIRLLESAFTEPDADDISLILHSIPDALELRIDWDSGYERLLGLGLAKLADKRLP